MTLSNEGQVKVRQRLSECHCQLKVKSRTDKGLVNVIVKQRSSQVQAKVERMPVSNEGQVNVNIKIKQRFRVC